SSGAAMRWSGSPARRPHPRPLPDRCRRSARSARRGTCATPATRPTRLMADEREEPRFDARGVPWRVFLAVGVAVLVLGGIYWATAYEEGGTVMLIVAGVLSLWIAAYLWR